MTDKAYSDVFKESNRNSRDYEDVTELEIDGIEDFNKLALETLEVTGNHGLQSRNSRDYEDITELEIDDIERKVNLEIKPTEDKVSLELKPADLLIDQGSLNQIDFLLDPGSQNQIDIVLEQWPPNQSQIVPKRVVNEQDERLQATYLAQQKQIKDLECENRRLITLTDNLGKKIRDLESIQNVYPLMNVELPDDIVLIPEDFMERRNG